MQKDDMQKVRVSLLHVITTLIVFSLTNRQNNDRIRQRHTDAAEAVNCNSRKYIYFTKAVSYTHLTLPTIYSV